MSCPLRWLVWLLVPGLLLLGAPTVAAAPASHTPTRPPSTIVFVALYLLAWKVPLGQTNTDVARARTHLRDPLLVSVKFRTPYHLVTPRLSTS